MARKGYPEVLSAEFWVLSYKERAVRYRREEELVYPVGLVYLVCLVGRIANPPGELKKQEKQNEPDEQERRARKAGHAGLSRLFGLSGLYGWQNRITKDTRKTRETRSTSSLLAGLAGEMARISGGRE